MASGQILCLFSFIKGSISFHHLLIKFPSATNLHVSLLVYRLKLPLRVSSTFLLFHIFTVSHLPLHMPVSGFSRFAGTKEIQRPLLWIPEYETGLAPQTLQASPSTLGFGPRGPRSLFWEQTGKGACLLTSEWHKHVVRALKKDPGASSFSTLFPLPFFSFWAVTEKKTAFPPHHYGSSMLVNCSRPLWSHYYQDLWAHCMCQSFPGPHVLRTHLWPAASWGAASFPRQTYASGLWAWSHHRKQEALGRICCCDQPRDILLHQAGSLPQLSAPSALLPSPAPAAVEKNDVNLSLPGSQTCSQGLEKHIWSLPHPSNPARIHSLLQDSSEADFLQWLPPLGILSENNHEMLPHVETQKCFFRGSDLVWRCLCLFLQHGPLPAQHALRSACTREQWHSACLGSLPARHGDSPCQSWKLPVSHT